MTIEPKIALRLQFMARVVRKECQHLVSTGGTLKANGLVAVDHISDISSRLVVNQAALKLKRGLIRPVIDAFAAAVTGGARA